MALLWKRNIAITFGPKGGEGIKVVALRASFELEKTSESSANTAKITIYNLNENHRGLLQNEENVLIILEVGYGEELGQLFIGDVTKVSIMKKGPDWVTSIEAGDGDQGLKDATLDKSYKAGVSLKTVVDDAIKSIKSTGAIVTGTIKGLKEEISQNGFSVSGLAQSVIDDITKKQGLEWSVQDNELNIIPVDEDTGENAMVLTSTTGLVGSPIRREKGIEFMSLITSVEARPGRAVKIESRDITGFFKLRKVTFVGDTDGNAWYMKGVCDEPKAAA